MNDTQTRTLHPLLAKTIAFILGAVTSLVALWQAFIVHDHLVLLVVFLVRNRERSLSLQYSVWLVDILLYIILLVGWLIFLIISTNYHSKHAGRPPSWRLFAKTIAIELLIFSLAYFV